MTRPYSSRLLLLLLCVALANCDTLESPPEAISASPPSPTSVVPLVVYNQSAASSSKAASEAYATTVVSAQQGIAVPSGSINPGRSTPSYALGAPNSDFFSLGFDDLTTEATEGELIVAFDQNMLFNGLALTVYEETFGDYPLEKADVFVAASLEATWQYIGTARSDGSVEQTRPTTFDVMGTCIQYVRIVDRSDRRLFASKSAADGFDVNAVGIDSEGTCATSSAVSGTVYSDANENGTRDNTESGLAGVVVRLSNGSTSYEATTDSDGAYSFDAPAGQYTLTIPMSVPDAFNGLLYDTHTSNRGEPATQAVLVGQTAGVDFGFVLDTDAVLDALNSGEIDTDTKASDFWVQQARHACVPSKAKKPVSPAQMAAYLADVEALLIPVPFQFGTNASCAAYAILKPSGKGEVAVFLRELLTAELNVVSDNGAVSDDFNQALLAFAEAIAAEQIYGIAPSSSKATAVAATLSEATTLLRAFNGSGGGDVGGEN